MSGTGSGVGVGSGSGGESSVTGGPKLTNCCRCNRTGSCRLCRCAKARRLCDKCLPGNHGRCQNRPARGALPSRPNQSPAVTATASCVVSAGSVTWSSCPVLPALFHPSTPLHHPTRLQLPPLFLLNGALLSWGIRRGPWAPHWITLSKGLLSFQLGPLCLLLKLLSSITSPRVLEMIGLS